MKLNTATATSASNGPETSALMCNMFWMQIRTQFLPNAEKAEFLVSEVVIAPRRTAHQNTVSTLTVSNTRNVSSQTRNVSRTLLLRLQPGLTDC